MINKLKELIILKKVIKNNLNKIKKTDIYSTQKEDTAKVNN